MGEIISSLVVGILSGIIANILTDYIRQRRH